jgi:putative AlgH/UPF0301 family transcriptional regulator
MKNCVGSLLIANPTNPEDELSRAVSICLTHTDSIGIALQINRIHPETSLTSVAQNLGIPYTDDDTMWYGGNVFMEKVHIVHSLDWKGLGTIALNKTIGVTHDVSILAALSRGQGPKFFKACAGYWLFDNGILNRHLSKAYDPEYPHKWEVLPATIENVFAINSEEMWEICLQQSIIKKVASYF